MALRISIRPFRAADMPELLAIEHASFGREAYDRKLFAKYARTAQGLFLIAATPRGAVGYSLASISRERPGLANLVSIAVHPPARGQGAASLLLTSTIRRLKLRGVERLTLMVRQSNAAALRFYQRHGFAHLRRWPGYYEQGEDGLLMRRFL
jgi:ribosomal protein S18 acetylase RimI-like enzyme